MGELHRVDLHLILLHHAAHRRHFGNVRDGFQLVFQEPVLQRTQLGEIVLSAFVHQRVLKDPADASGIRANLRTDALRQFALHLIEVLQHARARPVQIRPVFKNDVHVGIAELREAAHGLGARHGQHGGGERVGDLIFHNLRRLPRIAGFDDHLHVREIWQRIHRRIDDRPAAPGAEKQYPHHHQKTVGDRTPDNPFNHHRLLNARHEGQRYGAYDPTRR